MNEVVGRRSSRYLDRRVKEITAATFDSELSREDEHVRGKDGAVSSAS
jgi:hypothetical protein